jgi:hypothetical protein
MHGDRPPAGEAAGDGPRDPRPAAVTFVTTEHFVLQGEREATISEANGRASVFVGAVSGGLIAMGLIATASRLGTAFYAFSLIVLPTLAFLGLTTFQRAFQTGLDDAESAHRIARLRGFYFEVAPEVDQYLVSAPPIHYSRLQTFMTMAGTVAVITAVLTGSAVGLAVAVATNHHAAVAFPVGGLAAAATLALMLRYIHKQIRTARLRMLVEVGAELPTE